MPQPTQGDVHVDALLTNISVAIMQDTDMFVYNQVFPVIPSDKQSDKYATYTQDDWFRDEAQIRAGGTESAGSGYNVSSTTFSCDVYAMHKDIDDFVRENADSVFNLDRDATEFVTQRLMLRQERQWVSEFFVTGVWGTTVTGGTNFTRWNDYAASAPIADFETGKETILKNTGKMANTIVLGYQAFIQLKHHPQFVDRLKYTTSDNMTAGMLARFLEVDNVFVAKSIYATTNEGATTPLYDFNYGKHALLCFVEPNPGLLKASAGYTFEWTGISGGLGETIGMNSFRIDQLGVERIEGQVAFDFKIVASGLGYFFLTAVA